MASCLYFGEVMHQREQPVEYHFNYNTASIKIDVDRFANETAKLRFLSIDRFNLLSVHTSDHGSRDGTPWRQWLTQLLHAYEMSAPARIELICYPRILGYAFNPLAMWYAYDQNNKLYAIVAEVSNTFGQWHHYVLKHPQPSEDLDRAIYSQAQKLFHVSPFIAMQAEYHFKLEPPGKTFFTHIKETRDKQAFFYASQSGRSVPLSTQNLLKVAGLAPLRMFKVIALIHWWALKIWLKGGKFHKTPAHLRDVRNSHSEMKAC